MNAKSQLICSQKISANSTIRLHCLNRIRRIFYGSTLEEIGGTYTNFTRHNGKLTCNFTSQAGILTCLSRPLFPVSPTNNNVSCRPRNNEYGQDSRGARLRAKFQRCEAVSRFWPDLSMGKTAATGGSRCRGWLERPRQQYQSSYWSRLLNRL